ncbi:MAG: hypothetical protein GEU73_03170 [Chloroflexi bacterium]|nr:hypothetical protein [Chloroflexota bacterium]
MMADVSLTAIVIAGLAGAASMSVASFLFNALGIPMVDFGRLIATKILHYHSHGTRLGLVLHLTNGILLALVYALVVVQLLPGPYWVRGLAYGGALWLLMMAIMLPVLGDGFFGWRTSRDTIPSALAVHLLYGLILGFALRQ